MRLMLTGADGLVSSECGEVVGVRAAPDVAGTPFSNGRPPVLWVRLTAEDVESVEREQSSDDADGHDADDD